MNAPLFHLTRLLLRTQLTKTVLSRRHFYCQLTVITVLEVHQIHNISIFGGNNCHICMQWSAVTGVWGGGSISTVSVICDWATATWRNVFTGLLEKLSTAHDLTSASNQQILFCRTIRFHTVRSVFGFWSNTVLCLMVKPRFSALSKGHCSSGLVVLFRRSFANLICAVTFLLEGFPAESPLKQATLVRTVIMNI